MAGPNPLSVLWSILRARRVKPPRPSGSGTVEHTPLDLILGAIATGGVMALPARRAELAGYIDQLSRVDPDTLSAAEALAFWINLYNAGALDLARRAHEAEHDSVLRIGAGFRDRFVEVGDEPLSLDSIEHGKIRRFGDPRIHAALVCGSTSCPTLRHMAYTGPDLDDQLDDQMRHFLETGGAVIDRDRGSIAISRVFLWYGADFVRPHRMPTLLPASRRRVGRALAPWIDPADTALLESRRLAIGYQAYDWSLRCAVRRPPS